MGGREGLSKGALVVVKVLGAIVDTLNIDNYVAFFQLGRVPRPQQSSVGILG